MYKINSYESLLHAVREFGLLPLFRNKVEGFSVEEMADESCWFPEEGEGVWEWKGPVIREGDIAYGKFFGGKAGFVTMDWFPHLVNIRRRARFRPNLVGKEAEVYEAIRSHESLLTSEIRKLCGFQRTNRLKGQPVLDIPEPKPKRSPSLETILTRLEMRTFVVIADFEYRIDRYGQPYGWGLARYSTPEVLFKPTRLRAAACFKPDVSLERVCRHLSYYLPGATLEEIESLIDY